MNYQIDDVIKFKNGEYLVIDIIKKDSNTYLYLINNGKHEDDVAIAKVTNDDGVIKYSHIENEEEFNYVVNKIFLNLKDEIILFANEE